MFAGNSPGPSFGKICTPATLSGDTSVVPAGNPLDFRIRATRSLYVGAGSDPALTPFGMLVFTNVSKSATVFCVKPFQNASPVKGRLPPSCESVWQLEHDWLKVAVARAACASV